MRKSTRILKVTLNVLLWIFLFFSIVVTVLAFAAQTSSAHIPSFGGKSVLNVLTPSMEPEIKSGDIIIGEKVEDAEKLKVDTIITFSTGDLNGDGIDDVNTHRIIGISEDIKGNVLYVTKGDNNPAADTEEVASKDVICVYTGTRFAGVGKVLNYLQQPTGFLLVIVLPLILFFVFELIVFIKKFFEVKNSGKKQISAAEEEVIKQRAVEEYIRSRAAETTDSTEETQE